MRVKIFQLIPDSGFRIPDSGHLNIRFRLSDIRVLKKQRAASLFLAAFWFDREHRLAEEVLLLGKNWRVSNHEIDLASSL